MRDRESWHHPLRSQLKESWPTGLGRFRPADLLDVELGLYLLEQVMPTRTAADAWTLFSGYPYGDAFGEVTTADERMLVRRGRHYLCHLRRRREWRQRLTAYLRIPQELRGYDLDSLESTPVRRAPSRAPDRFAHYQRLLTSPPAYKQAVMPSAEAGEYTFRVQDRRYSVTFAQQLVPTSSPQPHDLAAMPAGNGKPLTVSLKALTETAAEMDRIEADHPDGKQHHWTDRLNRIELLLRNNRRGRFLPDQELRIDGMLHLVGMVGAGKSTLRDILSYWAATRLGLRITIVVGDVAETLAVTELFTRLGVTAAPVIGHSTRERHIQRLHRRIATTGAGTLLTHSDPGFAFLSSACAVDALRGHNAEVPLRIREAPCVSLIPVGGAAPSAATELMSPTMRPPDLPTPPARQRRAAERHLCPLWANCPRHHGARALVDAQIWVANPASLVHSEAPRHLHSERIQYLELACRLSDLVIVDEADRVQMQLDTAFAPATTLVGKPPSSWLDEVASHKVTELARKGRLQLSAKVIDDWTSAVNTVTTATDRIYALLIQDEPLRRWITEDYFSALTLHQFLLSDWFPELRNTPPTDPSTITPGVSATGTQREELRQRIDQVLDRFRDNPLQEQHELDPADAPIATAANSMVRLTLELLHTQHAATTRQRLSSELLDLVEHDTAILGALKTHTTRFEFTLLLAALHHHLDIMTALWPHVEAALNLEATSNVLSRRPPKDYEPVIPESPMGNVLGFQFQLGERDSAGSQSGELKFFRCGGVGRELLLNLAELNKADERPSPHVLLMSATSWAGTSSRYHVQHEVGVILRPHADEVAAILATQFRKEFLYWPDGGGPLRLSGCGPQERPLVLIQMLHQLAVADASLPGAKSPLQQELDDIEDPGRRRVLLLVGSYAEAKQAASYLNAIPEWSGRITQLISDDTDLDTAWSPPAYGQAAAVLSRGDVAAFSRSGGQILIAPLLAVERGHNIVVDGGKAAIGGVYFLARPHPRPDDIALAVQAINDWAVRQLRTGDFHRNARDAGTPDLAGLAFRKTARAKWNRFLTRQLSWSSLPPHEKEAFTWDQLVVVWQVIGRLVRGGVPARAVFVDAAFSPREAGLRASDTPATSLLAGFRAVLEPYFTEHSKAAPIDRSLVKALYEPLYKALCEMD